VRGGGDLTRVLEVPADAELFELDGGVGPLGAAGISSRAGTENGLALLVPGYTGSREDFYGLLGPLADRGFSVVAYSQRGQLGSVGPGGFGPCAEAPGYALRDFVDDLLAVAASLPARPHLLGHSFGGLVGLAAVLERPKAFASYTHWNSGPRTRGAHEGHLRALEAGGSAGLWEYLNLVPGALGDEEAWLHARMLATTSGNLWGGARILLDQVDEVEALRATELPVLVSHGEFDDVWDHEWQHDMAERLGADYRVIPGGSHSPQLEEPQACADVLAEFWRKHPAGAHPDPSVEDRP
jgi:pimeloyl-ACP methyl ester carboxylesterase